METQALPLPSPNILQHVVDVHCHPTDTDVSDGSMDDLKIKICAMSSRADDQPKVANLANRWGDKVIPCFGWHPWFSHHIALTDPAPPKLEHYTNLLIQDGSEPALTTLESMLPDLPDPTPLPTILTTLRQNLGSFPDALVGEVGIDRSFRIPLTPLRPDAPKKLSPFTVPIAHQLAILEAQIDVAIELRRSVSLHSVKAQQVTIELLKRLKEKHGRNFGAINIDFHSCGFSSEVWKMIEKEYPNTFLSISVVINSRSPAHESLIRVCSPSRILSESDYNTIEGCTPYTWEMVSTIARIKGWPIESEAWVEDDGTPESEWGAVRRLQANFRRFIGPGLGILDGADKQSRKAQRLNDPGRKWRGTWESESSDEGEDASIDTKQ